ncbi:MAG: DUF1501 domain-containing protein [Planctomycetia bacterium]|nr:DUF1501 domain-containing protein [Planctomycetia bacterium]
MNFLSRRRFLQLGSLAVASKAITPYAFADNKPSDDTSVIFLWLPGGPPHMETYDMKPDAPVEYRGDFKPIHTNVPGLDVCEHMPLHAQTAHRYSLIRSIHHTFSDHGGGHKKFLTARDPFQPTGFVNDYPMVGSMVAKVRQGRAAVPDYVAGTDPGRSGIDVFSFGSAYLGPSTHPFSVPGDPSSPKFTVRNLDAPPDRLALLNDRLKLLGGLDRDVPGLPKSAGAAAEHRQTALRLMNSEATRIAFDLTRESPRLRERYGLHAWGQRCLMARRLVEAGASFVTMVLENPYQSGIPYLKDGTYNWDSHAVNCHIFNDTKFRLPIFDRAVTALINDLHDRGLNKKVLLVVTGEFGRTPRISYSTGTQTGVKQPGRDHWPQAMSVLVSGGGLKMGQVVGSTNARGEHPKDRPLKVGDLWATVFTHLGIDYEHTSFLDHTGRPIPMLPEGKPIAELM